MEDGEVGNPVPHLPTLCPSHGHHACWWPWCTNSNKEDSHDLTTGRKQEPGGWREGAPPGAETLHSSGSIIWHSIGSNTRLGQVRSDIFHALVKEDGFSFFFYVYVFSPTEHGMSDLVSLGGRPKPSLVTFNLYN